METWTIIVDGIRWGHGFDFERMQQEVSLLEWQFVAANIVTVREH